MKYNLTLILVCFLFAGLKSQPETLINGTVTDSLGHAVPFATIALSDQSGGTYSDINGQFTLKVVQFPVSFIIRNVGYEQKELRIEEPPSSDISIILHEKATILREVVVTGTKAKPEMIGSPKSRKGDPVVTADVFVTLNERRSKHLVDPHVDLSMQSEGWTHKSWILDEC